MRGEGASVWRGMGLEDEAYLENGDEVGGLEQGEPGDVVHDFVQLGVGRQRGRGC